MTTMNSPFQRIGSKSNSQVGKEFENSAREFFDSQGIPLEPNLPISIGIELLKKSHSFDLVNEEMKILVECKSHRWTSGGNVPSAKLTVWNEAMYYFVAAPTGYRCIMFVLRDFSTKHGETLAQYYLRTYPHLIPRGVEFWEYDEGTRHAHRIDVQPSVPPDFGT